MYKTTTGTFVKTYQELSLLFLPVYKGLLSDAIDTTLLESSVTTRELIEYKKYALQGNFTFREQQSAVFTELHNFILTEPTNQLTNYLTN
jgi:hypothetical protein